MHSLRKLLRELHRRSIWQVLGIYLAGSWGVLQVVDYMTGFAGLPAWTPSFAFVLLLIGLPIVTATAFIQEGVPRLRGEYQDEVDPEELEGRTPEEVHRDPGPIRCTMPACSPGATPPWAASARARSWWPRWWRTWRCGPWASGPVGSLVAQGVIDARRSGHPGGLREPHRRCLAGRRRDRRVPGGPGRVAGA